MLGGIGIINKSHFNNVVRVTAVGVQSDIDIFTIQISCDAFRQTDTGPGTDDEIPARFLPFTSPCMQMPRVWSLCDGERRLTALDGWQVSTSCQLSPDMGRGLIFRFISYVVVTACLTQPTEKETDFLTIRFIVKPY